MDSISSIPPGVPQEPSSKAPFIIGAVVIILAALGYYFWGSLASLVAPQNAQPVADIQATPPPQATDSTDAIEKDLNANPTDTVDEDFRVIDEDLKNL